VFEKTKNSSEGRMFNDKGFVKYFVVQQNEWAVC